MSEPSEKEDVDAVQVIKEQGKPMSLSLIAALFIGVCTYFFVIHFSGRIDALQEAPVDVTSTKGESPRGEDETKWSFTKRVRQELLKDEARLKQRLAEKRMLPTAETEQPDRYVSIHASHLEEAIRAIGDQPNLNQGMREQLRNLESELH